MRIATSLVRVMSTTSTPRIRHSTYPKWTGPSQRPRPVVTNPAQARPLRPPPSPKCPNTLPARPPTTYPEGFQSSRHIIPAAFPRTYRESTGNLKRGSNPFTKSPATGAENKEERNKRNLEEARECVRARFNAQPTNEDDTQPGLWIAGERWIRENSQRDGKGLTLVLSAANGFTKEVRPLS
jgi:hypothetical protein